MEFCAAATADLIGTLDATSRLTYTLHGRQQHSNKYGNDRYYHDQFNEREATT